MADFTLRLSEDDLAQLRELTQDKCGTDATTERIIEALVLAYIANEVENLRPFMTGYLKAPR